MDLFSFIESKDIREHLRQIGYSFTAPEAAFLVWQCSSVTLKEKFAAWREIIRTMPDCSMEKRKNMDAMPSIHEFLEQYISFMERLLAKFYCKDNAVYSYSGSYWDNSDCGEKYERLYPNLVSCVAGFINDEIVSSVPEAEHVVGDYLQALAESGGKLLPAYPVSLNTYDAEIRSIHFKKRSLTSPGESFILTLNDRLEPVEIAAFGQCFTEEEENLLLTFLGMWFAFPTPFKRGDIVFTCDNRNAYGKQPMTPDELLVLDSLPTWGSEEMRQNGFAPNGYKVKNSDRWLHMHTRDGDTTDLAFIAYGIYDKEIINDNFGNYLLLERYDGPLLGQQRILGAVSKLLTGRIELKTFLKILEVVRVEEERKYIAELREALCRMPETAHLIDSSYKKGK